MSTTTLDRVLTQIPAARKAGRNWRARCPVHQGASDTSLSLREAEDGRVLLHCYAGCEPAAIVAELGLSMRDLFPDPPPPPVAPTAVSPARHIIAKYDYRDASGELRYQTVRLEPKGFFQRRPDGTGGWIPNLDGVERVLYHLPKLLTAPQRAVFLVEGEKDADALTALGLLATTVVGGASAPWLPQYSAVLRDKHLVLLGDNDAPGEARVRTLARTLLPIAKSVRIVPLPDLPPKGDVSDWHEAGGTKEELLAQVEATPMLTAADIASWGGGTSSASLPYLPAVPLFPVDVFPEALRRYVEAGAEAIGVPVDFIAIPLLGFAAATIGNTRALRVKAGWIELAILWLAVIGEPGSGKSPALSHARHPLDVVQQAAWERFGLALQQWELEVLAAKAEKPPIPPHRSQPWRATSPPTPRSRRWPRCWATPRVWSWSGMSWSAGCSATTPTARPGIASTGSVCGPEPRSRWTAAPAPPSTSLSRLPPWWVGSSPTCSANWRRKRTGGMALLTASWLAGPRHPHPAGRRQPCPKRTRTLR